MQKFFNYADYAEWRDSGDNCDRPVKLVGEGCHDWVDKYEDKQTIARLTAELTAANERAAASVEAVARANAERDALVAAAYEAAAKATRDVALVEAAQTARNYGEESYAAKMISAAILSIRTQSPQAEPAQVTVQEAARVLLDQPYDVMSVAFYAMEKLHGEGADRIMAAALRAIAGGQP